jgi:hypothetical protein
LGRKEIYLERLRKATKNLRIVYVSVDIPTGHNSKASGVPEIPEIITTTQ